jgi:hypothetical protein
MDGRRQRSVAAARNRTKTRKEENMTRLLCLAMVAVCGGLLAQENQGSAKNTGTAGWVSLFDGKSLNGWHPENDAKWMAVSGALVSDQSGDGWLRSDKTYTNFVLKLEYRNSPKGNSGVFFRATQASKAGDPPNPAEGYELQINNEDPKWATGSIEDVVQRIAPVNPAPNQWHTYELEVRCDHFVAKLDGTKTLDGRDAKLKSGYLGLQHHKNNKIEFRRIQIQDLGANK